MLAPPCIGCVVWRLFARWTEKLAGGPQVGISDLPPLARFKGVGRQHQHHLPFRLLLFVHVIHKWVTSVYDAIVKRIACILLYSSYILFDSSDKSGVYFVLHPLGIYLLEATRTFSTNQPYFYGMGSTSSINLSSYFEYPFQSAFCNLKCLLNGVRRATLTRSARTQIWGC